MELRWLIRRFTDRLSSLGSCLRPSITGVTAGWQPYIEPICAGSGASRRSRRGVIDIEPSRRPEHTSHQPFRRHLNKDDNKTLVPRSCPRPCGRENTENVNPTNRHDRCYAYASDPLSGSARRGRPPHARGKEFGVEETRLEVVACPSPPRQPVIANGILPLVQGASSQRRDPVVGSERPERPAKPSRFIGWHRRNIDDHYGLDLDFRYLSP